MKGNLEGNIKSRIKSRIKSNMEGNMRSNMKSSMKGNMEDDSRTGSKETVRTKLTELRCHSMFQTNNECNERKKGQDGSLEA